MTKFLNNKSFLDFMRLLSLSLLILLLFVKMDCSKSTNSRPVSECRINGIQTVFNPNPVTIAAGESAEVAVEINASSNCANFIKDMYVVSPDDNIGPPNSYICRVASVNNNRGGCTISVSVPGDEPTGIIQQQFIIHVSQHEPYWGELRHATATLDVQVLGAPDYSVSLFSGNVGVAQGRSTTVPVTIERSGGHSADIDLSIWNLPNKVDFSFDPNPVPGNENTSQMTVTAGPTAVPGEFGLKVVGNDHIISEKSDYFVLIVVEPFTLTTDTGSVTISQGQSGTVNIDISTMGGWNESISFTVEGDIIGQGATLVDTVFDPNPVPWDVHSTSLTLTAGESVEPGTYQLTIKGTAGVIVKNAELQLTVAQKLYSSNPHSGR